MHRYVTESLGSFFLVLSLGLAATPLAVGLIIAALYAVGYRISGAHFNPAISFAFALRKEIKWSECMAYFLAQTLGAFAAAGLVLYIGSEVYYVEPPLDTNIYQQSMVEFGFTILFALVYLTLAGNSIRRDLATSALLIGLTYTGISITGQPVSAGLFNPAISLGSAAIDFLAMRGESYEFIPLYVLGPLAGATVAAVIDRFLKN